MLTPYVFEHIPFPAVEGNPRNGEGSVIPLSDGHLMMVFGEFLGPKDHAPATLQGVISSDNGRTWGGKQLVQENIGRLNVMSASLLRLHNGEILLSFLRKDAERSHCTPFVRRSADEGRTWTDPEPVAPPDSAYYIVNNDRLVQLRGGRVLMPAYVSRDSAAPGNQVLFSDDQGRTWQASAVRPFLPESQSGPQEPGVIELRDGRIMMWCRCDLGEIYRCYSDNAAETFSAWEPMGLRAPLSPASIKRLPALRDLLCVFNNHETPPEYWATKRSPLTAALSRDEGATWRIVGNLEPDRTRSYCYTSITFLPEGKVLLTYYHGRDEDAVIDGQFVRTHYNLAHLKVAVFRERWLYEPK